MLKRTRLLLVIFILLIFPARALAQDYSYSLPQYTVHVFWNEDGTVSIDYVFFFQNDPSGHAIEYVDLAMPREDFTTSSITADVGGQPLTDISTSGYQGTGSGVAVGLGRFSIPPGESGTVHVFVGRVDNMYELDTQDDDYVSGVFAPATFLKPYVHGTSDITVTYHLPPAVQPDEPRWHSAPSGFSTEPETSFDDQDRITYTWRNPQADPSRSYPLGMSFPQAYVPESAVRRPNPFAFLGSINLDCLIPLGCIGFFALIVGLSIAGESRRKRQYLPPKIAIEGHGIKRGLTAVEAAILLEQPMDKILTMILFGVVKKGAAQVTTRDPLDIKAITPLPDSLRAYEKEFIQAFELPKGRERSKALQTMMIGLVKSVAAAMKGFSRRETQDYYRDIMRRAWEQVEAADTPEVKSQKYDEVMEWTMLDRDYDRRTREVFRTGPVFLPIWWGRYDPGFGRTGTATSRPSTTSAPSGGPSGGGVSLPNLPGSQFAASIAGGVQSFATGVVGNINEFTGRITQQTNPPPKPTATRSGGSRGGGGGRSCACACACAGCACACAGGGR